MSARSRVSAGLVAALTLAGCTAQQETSAPPSAEASPSGTVTVLAAASLSDVFEELGARLEDAHPGLDVRFSFAGSSTLAAQLGQGARADVFASADEAQMARLTDAGLAEDPETFARNPLMLVAPIENPAGIELPGGPDPGLADLIDEDVLLAVCAPEVPCGAAAAEVLGRAGLAGAPDTYEDDVRAVLAKVRLGEVDAGLVYLSDVHAAAERSIYAFGFREAKLAINEYPIAALREAANPVAAQAFVDLVLSDEGQQVLRDAGFLEP